MLRCLGEEALWQVWNLLNRVRKTYSIIFIMNKLIKNDNKCVDRIK